MRRLGWPETASIRRHSDAHIPQALAKAQQAKEVAEAASLLGQVRTAQGRSEHLYQAAEDILQRALDAKDLRTALAAIRGAVDVMGEARAHLELEGRLSGELNGMEGGMKQVLIVLPARREIVLLTRLDLPAEYRALDAEFEDVTPPPATRLEAERRRT